MKRTNKVMRSLAIVAVAALGLSACGSDSPESNGENEAGGEVPNLAFITGDISDFGQVQIEGMEDIVEPLGGSLTVFDSGEDVTSQNSDCMDVIASGNYNGIVLNPASGPGAVPCVEAAAAAGIPVAGLETPIGPDQEKIEPQIDGVIVSAASSLNDIGIATADLLEGACEGIDPCNFIQIVGSTAYQLEATRVEEIDKRIEGTNINRIALGEDGYNPERGRQVAGELIAANPEADVILIASDSSAVQVINLLEERGLDEDVIVLGDGASRQGVASMKEGKLAGTVVLVPYTFGEIAAQALVDHINGDPVITPEEVAEMVTPRAVFAEDIGDLEGQWG